MIATFPKHLATSFDDFLALLARERRATLPLDLEPWEDAVWYPLVAGGKRLRPLLCLATVEALGGDVATALPVAAALEWVHTFSLVHDDLPAIDDDDLRRGRPTTHIRYGEDAAVLVGDALLNGAYGLVLRRLRCPASRRAAVLTALFGGVDGMIAGQYLDVRPPDEPDEAWLRRMCGLKTGCLIEASVASGLALSSPPAATERAYLAFAAELGLGFQIVDDVLDATGTDEQLGKPAGSDAAHDKRTFVTVLGIDRARELADDSERRCAELLAALPGRSESLAGLTELVYARDR
jgi:geranylgeranyl diphosphate synthase type II